MSCPVKIEEPLIGGHVSDVTAAIAAGSRNIGYANKPGKHADLTDAGADAVIDRMEDALARPDELAESR
ncbi:hypothetical protein EV648_11029 [Kribbella sp. VKM Ac-2568]|nr:hypothetical protein EV648_11029 [Kribbella sp. VKM Ac-2568]